MLSRYYDGLGAQEYAYAQYKHALMMQQRQAAMSGRTVSHSLEMQFLIPSFKQKAAFSPQIQCNFCATLSECAFGAHAASEHHSRTGCLSACIACARVGTGTHICQGPRCLPIAVLTPCAANGWFLVYCETSAASQNKEFSFIGFLRTAFTARDVGQYYVLLQRPRLEQRTSQEVEP